MTSEPAAATTSDQRKLRKLMAAGLIGSSIEWYDFFIYGTAAALVFGTLFFPGSSPLVGTLLSFSTFWAGFIARPLGGLIFGHIGDRVGRKPALVTCLALVAAATCAIGLLPTAATIGTAAPILLVTLRFLQGIAVGGQWGGVTLLLTETTRPDRRGRAGTFGQLGVPFGLLLGTGAFLLVGRLVSGPAFLQWGWRIPFLASVLLFPVVLFIQLRIEDSPEFRRLRARALDASNAVAQAPVLEVLSRHWKRVLLGAALLFSGNASFYISVAGLLDYGVRELGLARDELLTVSMLSSAASAPVCYLAGSLSDRYGRRPLMLAGAAIMTVWAFPYFWLVNTGSFVAIVLATLVGSGIGGGLLYGPVAAFLAEMFEPRIRYSGITLAYQLAAILVSGGTPFLMTALLAATGGTAAVSGFLMLMALCTLASVWVLPETVTRRPLGSMPAQP
ncbi:MHS family MFS transporter [Nocardia sp. CDC159]|uniref:MHS family MFS transporter n=1 Tax=Nocardia pulmonis TaxID=2951408 RepID=A0A9X2E5D5_9NOCA|nr:MULTISPECIES: MFS transporter [Nocardia]MCM6771898.1 MHS family MFS transporter [Nocardia pulmonis]MCM6785444.1 MHS family MFS transporter [Nocardia sp. CDC159]